MGNDRSARMSRRRYLGLALAAGAATVSLAACSSTSVATEVARVRRYLPHPAAAPTSPSTPTAASAATTATVGASPSPVATPENVPGAVAAAYLAAWNAGHYADMYDLISADAQRRLSKDAFVQRYTNVATQATITKVAAALMPGQRADANIQQFSVAFDTILVGTIKEQNTITLAVDPGGQRWKVQWLPSLIFKELAGDDLIHMYPVGTPRGDIRARAGEPLATAGHVTTVYVLPKAIQDEPAMLSQLSQSLGLPQAVIKQKYAQSEANVQVPIKTLSLAVAAPIRDKLAAIPGVHVLDEPARIYPHGTLAAQTIGYISDVTQEDLKTYAAKGYRPGDVLGRAGIEQWGEPYLAGQWGGKLMVTTAKFDPVITIAQREPAKAGGIYLTLDLALQERCEELLAKRPGSIAVMRVGDGSLLALASYPGFDPNAFVLGISAAAFDQLVNDPLKPFLNRAVDGAYPTGTVFQPVTLAAALDHAGYTAQSTFDCSGAYTLGDTAWRDWKAHGHLGIVAALAQSCDVAIAAMGHREDTLSGDLLPNEAKGFGFGAWPHLVGLGSSSDTGTVPSPVWKQATYREGWLPGDAVNLSLGQGYLLASPLQVLNIYAALANGGTLWVPRVVQKVVGPDGRVVDANPARPLGTLPLSANALQLIREGLRDAVTSPLGTAYAAFNGLAVSAAGKTGTAQTGDGQAHAWFAAYAPFEQPEIAVVAMVEHGGDGAAVAAPLVRHMIEAYVGAQH